MATAAPALITPPDRGAIPPALFNACLVLLMINVVYFPIACIFSHRWIYHTDGLGIPTDFVLKRSLEASKQRIRSDELIRI